MRQRLVLSLLATLAVAFGGLLAVVLTDTDPALGLDLQGGISVTQQPVGDYAPESLDLAVERIRERVDSLGVAEPEIIRQGDAIVVNLPGVKNQQDAIELVQVTGQVYLRPVLQCVAGEPANTGDTTGGTGDTATGDTATGDTATVDTATVDTATGDTPTVDTATVDTPSATTAAPGPSRTPHAAPDTSAPASATSAPDTSAPDTATEGTATEGSADIPAEPPADGATTTVSLPADPIDVATATTQPPSDPNSTEILPMREGGFCQVGPQQGTGAVFTDDATPTISAGQWAVTVGLRGGAAGEGVWNAVASQCYSGASICPSRQLAIELDGEIISAPTVNAPTFSNNVEISGGFTESYARDLARVLKSGSLPVRMETRSVQTVSPTLGQDSLDAAIVSGLIGVALVLLFMTVYYRPLLGFVVFSGLAVSGALLYTIIALLSKTQGLALSLAGVAGVIVSVGVTVDSYVVFFERLKDEVRSGRTMRNSAQRGFLGAWRTILIADVVSLIGALVLWYLTVGAVRNFAFFLGLSTLCDLIVSWTFTRPTVLLLARTSWMARRKVMGIEAAQPATAGGAAPAGGAS